MPLNIAFFSLSEKSATIFFMPFHITWYDSENLSTGKLLSNIQRAGVKHSIMCR